MNGYANRSSMWSPIWWLKELFPGRRSYWAARAKALRLRGQPWATGRTDIVSYDGYFSIMEHFAYGPDGQQKQFLGASALRAAVRYAEKRNKEYPVEQDGAYDVADCPLCHRQHQGLMFYRTRRSCESATIWARCPTRSHDLYVEAIVTCHYALGLMSTDKHEEKI